MPGFCRRLNRLWRPDMYAAIGHARSRQGDIAFAVTGLPDHQVVLLTRGCARASLAVLTTTDGSEPQRSAVFHRGARIRTGGLPAPNRMLYQAELRPVRSGRV